MMYFGFTGKRQYQILDTDTWEVTYEDIKRAASIRLREEGVFAVNMGSIEGDFGTMHFVCVRDESYINIRMFFVYRGMLYYQYDDTLSIFKNCEPYPVVARLERDKAMEVRFVFNKMFEVDFSKVYMIDPTKEEMVQVKRPWSGEYYKWDVPLSEVAGLKLRLKDGLMQEGLPVTLEFDIRRFGDQAEVRGYTDFNYEAYESERGVATVSMKDRIHLLGRKLLL